RLALRAGPARLHGTCQADCASVPVRLGRARPAPAVAPRVRVHVVAGQLVQPGPAVRPLALAGAGRGAAGARLRAEPSGRERRVRLLGPLEERRAALLARLRRLRFRLQASALSSCRAGLRAEPPGHEVHVGALRLLAVFGAALLTRLRRRLHARGTPAGANSAGDGAEPLLGVVVGGAVVGLSVLGAALLAHLRRRWRRGSALPVGVAGGARPAAEPLPVEIRPGAGLLCELLTAAFAGLGVGLEERFRLVALLAKPTHQPRVDLDHRDLPAYDSNRLTFSCTPAWKS